MPALTVKNIPDELYEHLKTSARVHHRSINSELIHCLETALMPRKPRPEELVATARALRRQVKATRISIKEIDAARKEGRK
ncbi:MAG: Arc family DNA-binding protein [Pseudomonadota bacterium]